MKLADLLSQAIGYCSEDQSEVLQKMLRKILEAPFEEGDFYAKFLKAISLNKIDSASEKLYETLLHDCAAGGISEAQYIYGCILYDKGKQDEAIKYYLISANNGYSKSQWCYGTDLFHGTGGLQKDEAEGLFYIELAAGQLNNYALEFLVDLYSRENGSIRKCSRKAKKYSMMLEWAENREEGFL
ncbi:MAG: hypothetical protein V3W04_15455 [Gammaproteobacteria bacterium]